MPNIAAGWRNQELGVKKVTLERWMARTFRRELIIVKSLYQRIRTQNEGSIGVRRVRPYTNRLLLHNG
jgi:hypothetical protein